MWDDLFYHLCPRHKHQIRMKGGHIRHWQAVNQSTLRKLAQPHKLKINPNFQIWTNLDNLDNFVSFNG